MISDGGAISAASGVAGIAPGGCTAIYGTGLAAATRIFTASDEVNGYFPASLGGVSVQINGNAAFVEYVSPTQINVLAPADTAVGSVPVTVTNAAGVSAAIYATLQSALPALFMASSWVRAVRVSDGYTINGTGASEAAYSSAAAAQAGDVLELYGTGFGPVTGSIFQGAYPTQNAVGVTIGSVSAPVSFAGLTQAGLYQINVTVPAGLSAGDHEVIATANGVSSQSGAKLKIAG